ncbi:MAG: serine/threonine protein kinase [Phycisphaeraceae bacterium]|nr:MAG: serine/threonine protein kinase [Phycisphaeraceae bacterium]
MDDRERFEQVAALFEAARSRHGAEREALLIESKHTDPGVVDEVRRLLDHHETADGPLSEPIVPRSGFVHDVPPPPASINQYRVLRQIGAGGMGVVYLAEQDKPRREVAIKVIRPGLMTSESLRRFDVEAAALGRLRHPGVAQIYEAGAYDDGSGPRPFFAMEYVDGRPLLAFAEAEHLTIRERLGLMARLCAAVHHAHQRGVIHRDLKPGNVVVDAGGQPKVLDFGVARAADGERNTLNTIAGELIGTVGYMSPEQVAGDAGEVDTRTDVHALGVILYELLCGKLPYDIEGVSLATALHRVRDGAQTPLGAIKPALRGDLETICAKAIERDKDRRYQSVSALEADMRRYLRDEPIAARPPSTLYLLGKFARRNRALVTAASLAVLSLVAMLVATTVGVIEVSRQRDEAVAAGRAAAAANEFLGSVMLSLDPRERGDGAITLEDFLDSVSSRIDSGQLDDQPEVEAAVRGTIGTAYSSLGLLEQARVNRERTLALLTEHEPENTTQIADVMGSLGTTYLQSGDFERAEPLLVDALALIETVRPEGAADRTPSFHADALQRLAQLRIEQRRLDEAIDLSRRALAIRHRLPNEPRRLIARTLNTLAVALRLSGDLDGAREAYEQALELQRNAPDEPRLDIAATLNNLALVFLYQNRPAEAVPPLDEALQIRESILPADHPDIGRTLNSLGGARQTLGDLEGAADAYRRALAIRRATLGDDHPSVAITLINLGAVLSELGRHDEAIGQMQEAAAIRRGVYGEDHPRFGGALIHVGRAMLDAGRAADAEPVLAVSVDILTSARDAPADSRAAAQLAYARCLSELSEFGKAEQQLLNAYDGLASLDPRTEAQRHVMLQTVEAGCELYARWVEVEPTEELEQKLTDWNHRRDSLSASE